MKTYPSMFYSLGLMLLLGACSAKENGSTSKVKQASTTNSVNSEIYRGVALKVYDASNALIFSSSAASSMKLIQGVKYNVNLAVDGVPPGTPVNMLAVNQSIPNDPGIKSTMRVGDNNFTAPLKGDYRFSFSSTEYQINKTFYPTVSCPNPAPLASILNANNISVSGNQNLYDFSAAGIFTSGNANDYDCAWDPTGSGIVSVNFASCANAASKVYVNYVGGPRKIGLIVRHRACLNSAQVYKDNVNLAFSVPAMPGNAFITGNIAETDSDPRISKIQYLATNVPNHYVVNSEAGGSAFTVTAQKNYYLPSSQPFGMKIAINGLSTNIDLASASGSVDFTDAYIDIVEYITDQAGDQRPSIRLSSKKCEWTRRGGRILPVTGLPCASNTTGTNNQVTLELYGDYRCTEMTDGVRSVTISGSFDGAKTYIDSCVGGGGGSTGGIFPFET